MRRARFAAAGVIAVAAVLIATVGAAASTEPASSTNTARAGAKLFTPHGGKTRHVVKVSTWSSSFECSPNANPYTTVNSDGTQFCEVTGPNARCVEKSSSPAAVQTCIITQTDADNNAYILQDNSTGGSSTSGLTQTQNGTQTATVTQAGTNNSLDATQTMNQSLHAFGSITQSQDGHQFLTLCQGAGDCHATNSGVNTSKIHQQRYADSHANGGTIVQQQDVNFPNGDCDPFDAVTTPNLCISVEQNSSVENDNDSHSEGHLNAVAAGTPGSMVRQKQQKPTDGIDGHVGQLATTQNNNNNAHLHLTDDMSAPPGANQSQDPELDCCSQGGKSNIHEVGILRASDASAFQQLDILGNSTSNGSCLVLSHGKINGFEATDRSQQQASGETPAVCSTEVFCQFPSEGPGGCTAGVSTDSITLASLGFDTLDFSSALNFVFPLSLPLTPV